MRVVKCDGPKCNRFISDGDPAENWITLGIAPVGQIQIMILNMVNPELTFHDWVCVKEYAEAMDNPSMYISQPDIKISPVPRPNTGK